MKSSSAPSFVLMLKLNTNRNDDRILVHRFYIAFLMKNRLIKHARKTLSAMRQDKEYRALMAKRFELNKSLTSLKDKKLIASTKKEISNINDKLKRIRMAYGLDEYAFHAWIAKQQHKHRRHIDSMTAQKIASSVWRATEAVLFRKGKQIHFKKLDDFNSLEGKNNNTGIRFKNGRLYWNGIIIQPHIHKNDVYAKEALRHKVKYCRIKRMAVGSRYHYYLQLVLEGKPPKKHTYINGRAGIDPGTSSEAVFSSNGCILTEIAPNTPDKEKYATRLQRKLDRSRRANNPDNYKPDGTVKKGKKTWINSKTYKKDKMRLKFIRRAAAASVKDEQCRLINTILTEHGSDICTEKMDYKALQARAKETKKTKTGRYARKKRFGKSLSKHAPAQFLDILDRKLGYIGKTIFYVDTWHFKASQYDHVLGDYKKGSAILSKRSKTIGGNLVQRDLYSAFLLYCAFDEITVDRSLCSETFPLFLRHQDTCIKELMNSETALSSFGLKDFMTA